MNGRDLTYAGLKALSKELRRPVSTLYALAIANDPFYVTPARTAASRIPSSSKPARS